MHGALLSGAEQAVTAQESAIFIICVVDNEIEKKEMKKIIVEDKTNYHGLCGFRFDAI